MGGKTKISWTDHTFNPWMGCTKVSEGCKHCYARDLAKNRMGLDLWGDDKERKVTKTTWGNVRKWNREAEKAREIRRVFIGSMMDVFEGRVELEFTRKRMFELIKECQSLVFQLLTKRSWNIRRMLPEDWGEGWSNVWIGVTVEDQYNDYRVEHLKEIPCVCRFVSYEPAIGPLNLGLEGIHWVIYGGESGKDHRVENLDWARNMMKQCKEANVPFFFKQVAGTGPAETRKKLDGKVIQAFPERTI